MRKFMVPVDGSENSLRAVHYAVSLARDESPAVVFVITVQADPVIYGDAALYIDYAKLEQAQREQSAAILKPAADLLGKAGVRFETEVLRGDAATSIVRRAEELGCDVIVIGTRGMGALASLVLGSTALKVVHHTKLPVTLIK